MGDEYFDFYRLLNEIDNENNLVNLQLIEAMDRNFFRIPRKYHIRKRLNPMSDYDNEEFKQRFRLSKVEAYQLYDLIDGSNTLEPAVSIHIHFIAHTIL